MPPPEVAALWRRAATLDKEVARASRRREAHRHADVALAFVRGVVTAPVGVSGAGKGAGKGKKLVVGWSEALRYIRRC